MLVQVPEGKTGKELFNWLITNKELLITQKKMELKRADSIAYSGVMKNLKGKTVKAAAATSTDPNTAEVSVVINTTFWYDSHGDVHIDGIWKKSLSENRNLLHLQEHKNEFDHLISDDVRAFTKKIKWKELDINFDGETEALVFDSSLKRKTNPKMFERYKDGEVKQHSVGMYYVKMDLAINNEDYPAYYELWNKYIDRIANKEAAEDAGYFWPVFEAKAVEGSAVLLGSNRVTPTISVKNTQPPPGTVKRAANSTRLLELNKLLTTVKSIK